jgi:hypothetical protein
VRFGGAAVEQSDQPAVLADVAAAQPEPDAVPDGDPQPDADADRHADDGAAATRGRLTGT